MLNQKNRQSAEENKLFAPPGHFYSPIPDLNEIKQNEEKLFHVRPRTIPGVELNEEGQIRLFDEFKGYYAALPFTAEKTKGLRYYFENPAFSYADGIFLYSMIRHVKPKRIIEVGSGYSSAAMLDTNELFFGNSIECKFIEPYPELLMSLMKENDQKSVRIISAKLQDVDLNEFSSLTAGDILFIDSTHVSKTNSDVNYVFFELLPSLSEGVYIHIHDIMFPFEYPKDWVYEGRAWNEAYLLRAFLQYNSAFEVVFFYNFLQHFHRDRFAAEMPLVLKNSGGSIWLRKKMKV
jgi:predicted O-methyltransferase YrrM